MRTSAEDAYNGIPITPLPIPHISVSSVHAQAVLVFYIFGRTEQVATDISGYSGNTNSKITVGDRYATNHTTVPPTVCSSSSAVRILMGKSLENTGKICNHTASFRCTVTKHTFTSQTRSARCHRHVYRQKYHKSVIHTQTRLPFESEFIPIPAILVSESFVCRVQAIGA